MRRIVFFLIWLTGIPFVLRQLVQRNKVTMLCYHNPTPDVVAAHLGFLTKAYSIISLRRYVDWRKGRYDEPLPRKALVITVDDGHRDNYRLKELMEVTGVPITIFLCSGIVGTSRHYWWTEIEENQRERLKRLPDNERLAELSEARFNELKEFPDRQALSVSEIDQLKTVVEFQAHSRLHPILPRCPLERAVDEIAGAKTELESKFGLHVYALAYPNGDYSAREIEIARMAGYDCALTLEPGYNTGKSDLFRLRRLPVFDDAGLSELIVKSSGMWEFLRKIQLGRRHRYTVN